VSQADGSSAEIKSGADFGLRDAAVGDGWRENVGVLLMVLAPLGLAIILVAMSVFALAAWQIMRGVAVELPSKASIQLYGLLAYAVASWIDLAVAWLWASRRGLSAEIFRFREMTRTMLAASLAGFAIAMYGVPIATWWLSDVTGGRGPARIDSHDAQSLAVYVFLFVITTPVSEEVLYRGLLVAWLRRLGWRDSAILPVGSLIFGANHLIPLGFVWASAMVGFGAILFALRLRYDSLSPAWAAHFLFNAHPLLILPLIQWLAPALLPGRLY
jgi:membrane protease YdiL (CAAX protease family)